MEKTKLFVVFKVLQQLYEMVLRKALLDYVKKTDNSWDDYIVNLIDMLIYANYKSGIKDEPIL